MNNVKIGLLLSCKNVKMFACSGVHRPPLSVLFLHTAHLFRASGLLHSSFQPPHYPHHHTPSPTSSMFALGHHPLPGSMVSSLQHPRPSDLGENAALAVSLFPAFFFFIRPLTFEAIPNALRNNKKKRWRLWNIQSANAISFNCLQINNVYWLNQHFNTASSCATTFIRVTVTPIITKVQQLSDIEYDCRRQSQ